MWLEAVFAVLFGESSELCEYIPNAALPGVRLTVGGETSGFSLQGSRGPNWTPGITG